MALKYWLMKSDPDEFSIDDLQRRPNRTEPWDGVRNYQARNFMRDKMGIKDRILFYHSRINPSVVGAARVVKPAYPDHTAWDPENDHYDPKSSPENPIWFMVDIQLENRFKRPVSLKELRSYRELENMILLRRGNRLSITPVTREEFNLIVSLGKK